MIVVITGATGTGKSRLAIELAKLIDGEIVNADAFQVYQELSIATSKPTPSMMAKAPHHLFGFVPLTVDYAVATYQKDLRRAIKEILSRGKTPIIAGGTGLYIKAGLYDYDFAPNKVVDLAPYQDLADDELYRKLQAIDPEEAKKIHPHNRVRVLRAIEIFLINGQTKTDIIASQKHEPIFETVFFGLKKEREDLYPAVEERVDEMFKLGLVEENKRLVTKYGSSPHAFKAIGVKELFPYFDGKTSLEEAKNTIKENTRHYIKRQETFFRHQFNVVWVESAADIVAALKGGNK